MFYLGYNEDIKFERDDIMKEFAQKFLQEYGNYPIMTAKDSKYASVEFNMKKKFNIFRPHRAIYTWDEQYELIVHQIRTHIIEQIISDSYASWDEIMFDGYFPGHVDVTDKVTKEIHDLNPSVLAIPMHVEYTHPPSYFGDKGVIVLPNAVHAEDIAVSKVYEMTNEYIYIDYCKIILSSIHGQTEKFYDRMKMNRIDGTFSMEGKLESYPQWLDSINSKYDLYQNPNNRPAWDKIIYVDHYDGKDVFIDWDNKLCYLNTNFGWSCMDLNYAKSYINHSELIAAINVNNLKQN